MADDTTFADFLRRIRAGDEQAAAELVHRYEAAVRLAVRMRLGDARLRRVLDSMDVCQSVLPRAAGRPRGRHRGDLRRVPAPRGTG
jgi:hypothetical protein